MRVIGFLLLPGTRTFDVAVAAEIWGVDRTDAGIGPFEPRICEPGAAVQPLAPVGHLEAPLDLAALPSCNLIIVPGRADSSAPVPATTVATLRAAHVAGVCIAALCSGAFILAAAGLLDGRAATTHWRLLDALTAAAPAAAVHRDVLFTTNGSVLTSAGVVGGLGLCLHLVRWEHGADIAARLARRLVMPPTREGGQRQHTDAPLAARPARSPVAATIDWATDQAAGPISVRDMAAHAAMSQRTFHRAFAVATGTTPGRRITVQRVRLARRLLKTTNLPVYRVAERCGLGTAAAQLARVPSPPWGCGQGKRERDHGLIVRDEDPNGGACQHAPDDRPLSSSVIRAWAGNLRRPPSDHRSARTRYPVGRSDGT